MSNFIAKTRHKMTGEVAIAEWLDDHFGRHQYGVRFPDGRIFRSYQCETIDDECESNPVPGGGSQ